MEVEEGGEAKEKSRRESQTESWRYQPRISCGVMQKTRARRRGGVLARALQNAGYGVERTEAFQGKKRLPECLDRKGKRETKPRKKKGDQNGAGLSQPSYNLILKTQ